MWKVKSFKNIERAIDRALDQARLTKDDIDAIKLLEGACRILKVYQLINQKLGKTQSYHSIVATRWLKAWY